MIETLIGHPGIVGWSVLALDGAMMLRVITVEGKAAAARVAWLLAILLLPIAGAVAYLLLGEARLGNGARRRAQWAEQRLATVMHADEADERPAPFAAASRYRNCFDLLASLSGLSATDGNEVTLAPDAKAAIDALVSDIDAATRHVHVSFYIWLDDHSGNRVADAICRAARRGVACRIMVDAIGSRAFVRTQCWRQMGEAGAELAVALPPPLGLGLVWGNRIDVRNHRKIVVIDDWITHFGSRNCADPEFRVKASFAPWVDMMVRLTGPAARGNQVLFLGDWMARTEQDLAHLAAAAHPPKRDGDAIAAPFGTGPTAPPGAMSSAFVGTIYAASRELVVTTPYFVPDQPLLAALLASARRGVATTLIVPARNDSRTIGLISRGSYSALLEAGVRIFEFQGGLLHAKSIVVDCELCLIGSSNMDRRSLELNFENNVLIHSPDFAASVRRRQNEYLADSREVTVATRPPERFGRRIAENLTAMFGPIF